MSAYTDITAVQGQIRANELIQLTDDNKTGQIDTTILNAVIASASGVIDSKVASMYGEQLPFNPIPSSVASMALTITCYQLYRRAMIPDEKNKFYESYAEIMEFLNKVNKGEAMIDDVVSRDFSPVVYAGRRTLYGNMKSNIPSNSM